MFLEGEIYRDKSDRMLSLKTYYGLDLERDQDTRLLENILVKVTWHYYELVSKS